MKFILLFMGLAGLPSEHVPQSVAQDHGLYCPDAPTWLLAAQPRSHLEQQLGIALPTASASAGT